MWTFPWSEIELSLSRDSVCAGDDALAPHAERRTLLANTPIAQVLAELVKGYLPSIAGPATWLARFSGPAGVLLAVVVQGEDRPRWVTTGWSASGRPEGRERGKVAGYNAVAFTYRAGEDPDRVMESL